jgi:hypothetical protein
MVNIFSYSLRTVLARLQIWHIVLPSGDGGISAKFDILWADMKTRTHHMYRRFVRYGPNSNVYSLHDVWGISVHQSSGSSLLSRMFTISSCVDDNKSISFWFRKVADYWSDVAWTWSAHQHEFDSSSTPIQLIVSGHALSADCCLVLFYTKVYWPRVFTLREVKKLKENSVYLKITLGFGFSK